MSLTTNPNDPRLGRGSDTKPVPQNEVYLILSEDERAKGFIRPYRNSYEHIGMSSPKFSLVELTDEQKQIFVHEDDEDPYIKKEHDRLRKEQIIQHLNCEFIELWIT